MQEMLKRLRDICTYHDCISGCPLEFCGQCLLEPPPACWEIEKIAKVMKGEAEFHCGVEESGGHAYNCNDCPNKCDEWHQWDKEFREKGDE